MKTIITMILLLIAGQASAGEQLIDVQHDSVRGVTCWILNNTGISCRPDSSLRQQGKTIVTPESEAALAPMAISPGEKDPTIAGPLPKQKGLQL